MNFHDANGNTKKGACFLKAFMFKISTKKWEESTFRMSDSHGTDKIPHINTWKFNTILSARCKSKTVLGT